MEQLKKLRGLSLAELRTRGQQELTKMSERWLKVQMSEISDTALLREIEPAVRNGSGEGTAALIAERLRHSASSRRHGGTDGASWSFFPAAAFREEIAGLMRERFPVERRQIIESADRAIAGRFDLLGLSDLSFGQPIEWRCEPVSGKRTSLDHWSLIDYLEPQVAGDKKVTWELSRCQHFVTFGQAYWLTGDERYVEAFIAQASAWMDANPPKRGINWTSSLELALRVISWLWAWHLCADSPRLTSAFVKRLLKYLITHGRHIETYLSRYFSPNTHLTGEALGLFYLGVALPELRLSPQWRELGLRILIEQLPIHVRPDGVYFEQSSYYHRYTTDFYTHLWLLARASRLHLPVIVEERLRLLLDHLMWITRPDGNSPFYGDDDGGVLLRLGRRPLDDFRETLATGAAIFQRGDWKFVAGPAAVETLWLLGPEGLAAYDGLQPAPPRETTRAFSESGYFVMRDGWEPESSYVLVDCGAHGALTYGHAHSDALSFEFASGGVNWIVDPGTFTYTGDAQARDYFRSTGGHNTVVVDGEPQSITAGPFSWSQIAEASELGFTTTADGACFEGAQNGFERLSDPVRHERSARLMRRNLHSGALPYLVICDRFSAHAGHRYEVNFHFSAGCRAIAVENQVRVIAPDGHELILVAVAQGQTGAARPRARIEPGWVSRGYGQREPAPVAVIEAAGSGDQTITTIIVPFHGDQTAQIEQFVEAWERGARSAG